jgi:hypothetical protein
MLQDFAPCVENSEVHTDIQINRQGGKPVFAVAPYDKWLELAGKNER